MDRNKKIILILDVLLFVGLLVYSVIFLIINKSLNPATIAGNDIHIRLMWRQAAETIFTVCSFVYVIGHILIIYSFASRRISASLRTIFLYFTTQVGLMFYVLYHLRYLIYLSLVITFFRYGVQWGFF